MRREKVAGASIALIDDQEIVWAEGFGYEDKDNKRRARADSVYQAGDLTKIITTVAVLQLVERGYFTLDTPLSTLLPSLTISSRFSGQEAPTLRQLLTHHSGLPAAQWAAAYGPKPQTESSRIDSVQISQPTGLIYAYSNQAFDLVGQIIERYSGQPYAEQIQQTLLTPLGMVNAGFVPGGRITTGHDKRGVVKPAFPRDLASLGLLSSVSDSAKFVHWLLRDDTAPILSRTLLEQMQQSQNDAVTLDLDNRTGLGWQLTNAGRHQLDKVLRINASTLNYRGIVLVAPAEKVAVVLFSNSSNATDFVIDIGRHALDKLLRAKYGRAIPDFSEDLPDDIERKHGVGSAMESRYSTALGLIEFAGTDDRFAMKFLGRRFVAKRRPDGWFKVSYRLLGLVPLRWGILRDIVIRPAQLEDRELLLVYYQNQVFLLGTALTQMTTRPSVGGQWQSLTGKYRLLNPDPLTERLKIDHVRVSYESGQLIATYRLPIMFSLHLRMPLEPLAENRFFTPGLGTNLGDELVFRAQPDGLEMSYSGYRFVRD